MRKYVKFGITPLRRLTGAELYVRAFQLMSVLPALHIFMIAGYPGIITRRGFFGFLFDLGMSCLPRAEVYGISLIYRLTSSEILVNFAVLVIALAFGLVMGKLLRGQNVKRAIVTRYVLAALIAVDLVLRLIPFGYNSAFGIVPNVIGFVFGLAGLACVILDLRMGNGEQATVRSEELGVR